MFGVRYILSGSLRRSERLVRVSVELCDTNTGATLWGEKSEIAPNELFDVQDRIVTRIVAGIAPNVRAAELRTAMRKKPENFSAYDCTLRALHIMHSLDRNTFLQARDYLLKAMEEDPEFAMPVAWAARWYGLWVGQSWSADPVADRAKALELAGKAIELDGQNALALSTYGHLKSFLAHDYDSALVYFERALAVWARRLKDAEKSKSAVLRAAVETHYAGWHEGAVGRGGEGGSVGRGRHAVGALEAAREGSDALQAHGEADVCDRAIGGPQECRRALHPAREQVGVGRLAEGRAELTAEVGL